MMNARSCADCGKPFQKTDRPLRVKQDSTTLAVRPWPQLHPQCVTFPDTFDTLTGDSKTYWLYWHIQQGRSELLALRQKADTLLEELIRASEKLGATEQDIEDIKAEYNIYDRPQRSQDGSAAT